MDFFSLLNSIFEIREIQIFFTVILIGVFVYIIFIIGRRLLLGFSMKEKKAVAEKKGNEEVDEASVLESIDKRTKEFYEAPKQEKGKKKQEEEHEVLKQTDNITIAARKVKVEDKEIIAIKLDYHLIERIAFITIIVIEAVIVIWGFYR